MIICPCREPRKYITKYRSLVTHFAVFIRSLNGISIQSRIQFPVRPCPCWFNSVFNALTYLSHPFGCVFRWSLNGSAANFKHQRFARERRSNNRATSYHVTKFVRGYCESALDFENISLGDFEFNENSRTFDKVWMVNGADIFQLQVDTTWAYPLLPTVSKHPFSPFLLEFRFILFLASSFLRALPRSDACPPSVQQAFPAVARLPPFILTLASLILIPPDPLLALSCIVHNPPSVGLIIHFPRAWPRDDNGPDRTGCPDQFRSLVQFVRRLGYFTSPFHVTVLHKLYNS